MISRKIASFGLALSVLVSSAAIAYADENTKEENNDYPVAARTMEDAGMPALLEGLTAESATAPAQRYQQLKEAVIAHN